jgi:hypothetical protein
LLKANILPGQSQYFIYPSQGMKDYQQERPVLPGGQQYLSHFFWGGNYLPGPFNRNFLNKKYGIFFAQ